VLEGEFYAFVLAPHDALLRKTYGVGANDIASAFRTWLMPSARDRLTRLRDGEAIPTPRRLFAEAHGKPFEGVAADWLRITQLDRKSAGLAFDDMLACGICNVAGTLRSLHYCSRT